MYIIMFSIVVIIIFRHLFALRAHDRRIKICIALSFTKTGDRRYAVEYKVPMCTSAAARFVWTVDLQTANYENLFGLKWIAWEGKRERIYKILYLTRRNHYVDLYCTARVVTKRFCRFCRPSLSHGM